jgi:hypothetical protein
MGSSFKPETEIDPVEFSLQEAGSSNTNQEFNFSDSLEGFVFESSEMDIDWVSTLTLIL